MNFCFKKFLKCKFLCVILLIFAVLFKFNFSCYALAVDAQNGAILIDAMTGEVLFEQSADKIAPIASTTKIVSTMVVLENAADLDEEFEVDFSATQVEGTSMGLCAGDVVTLRDLCYGMMLASGNDAANAAAIKVAGTVENFVRMMNEKAMQLGCENTVFRTPSGLDSEGEKPKGRGNLSSDDILNMPHSTARELAILTREAMKNETFKEICALKKVDLYFGNPPIKHTFYNHNKLLKMYKDVCCGVKTGFTKNAGRCLVSAGRENGIELIAVVLNDESDWLDSRQLLDYGFSKFHEYEINYDVSNLKVKVLGELTNEIKVQPEEQFKIFLTETVKKAASNRIKVKVDLPEYQFAPINADDCLGELEYYLDGNFLGYVNLVASEDVLS